MTAIELINKASGEIGYKEGSNNDNKYGIEYGMNNQPWCVIFLWWCFKQAGDDGTLFPKVAHCDAVRSYAQYIGRWTAATEVSELNPGDIIVWDYDADNSGDHIGLVCAVDYEKGKVITIEGNSSDEVAQRVYYFPLTKLMGIYAPEYEVTGEVVEDDAELYDCDCVNRYPVITYGCGMNNPSKYVQVIQALLTMNGYDCGEIDGEYGDKTLAAVNNFKSSMNLYCDIDGTVDAKVWFHLIKNA